MYLADKQSGYFSNIDTWDEFRLKAVLILTSTIEPKYIPQNISMIMFCFVLLLLYQGPFLLTWFNFNPSMDK